MRALLVLSFLLTLVGCSATHTTTQTLPKKSVVSDTMEMRRVAAEQYPASVIDGSYTLKVVATGQQRNAVFLNTQEDYRDPRNITIALSPKLAKAFYSQHQQQPQDYFKGKTIAVSGELKQVEILFLKDGRPSGKYYYQTHVRPGSLDDIRIVSAG
ncbi:hypothetical protein [Alteromonas antoniana]|uniref:hypothetical protein n=1 Tax=Alteromonas antoniana TaxID=2803813 RepID=UPI001C45501D|nr:hypothetical protein [Alteromonas antoniana]